ncbi:MAG: DUF4397 domain-containing protein [Pseudomonadales bacterium]
MSRLFRGTLVAVFVLLLTACGKDEGFTSLSIPAAFLRVANAMPDSPQLNVLVNGRLVQRVNFGQSSTFIEVLPDLSLRFTVNYVQGGEVIPLITDEPLIIGIDHDATVIIAGTLANPRLVKLVNPPIGSTAVQDQLEVQIAHVAALSTEPVQFELKKGAELVQDMTLDFGEFTDLTQITGGDYTLTARSIESGSILWESGDFSLAAGVRGLFILVDHFGPGDGGIQMLSVGEQFSSRFANENLPAAVRIANMTPDRGPLDVYVDDVLFAENLAFGSVTDYLDIPVGEFDLSVKPFGDASITISENADVAISSGNFHTIALTGLADVNNSQLYVDNTRRVSTRLLLSATNTAPSFTNFDLYVMAQGSTVDTSSPRLVGLTQLPSTNSSLTLTLEAGSYDLAITANGNKDILHGPTRIDVSNGGLYSLFITDSFGGGEPIEIVFADDFN